MPSAAKCCKAVGVQRLEDLFGTVPGRVRFPSLNLPPPISQPELAAEMRVLAGRKSTRKTSRHSWGPVYTATIALPPSTMSCSRGEFYTSYTPYQPEISQGMLQAMFEYQTMVCRLTGMEVSNASHYDGATSLAEAVCCLSLRRRGERSKIVMSPAVHPQFRQVVKTYLWARLPGRRR